jgi:hypothetical protein
LNNNVKLIKKAFAIETIGKFGAVNIRKSSATVQRSHILFYLLLITCVATLSQCAHPVSPQGGPKDVVPPVVISSDPPVYSTHFTGDGFRVDFDEFIKLKNAATEIFISPALKGPIDTRLRGKSLIAKFEGIPDSNTTYSVSFGKSLTDLTEGNVLTGFKYVFSTGAYVDSLSLMGTLQSAFDHQPQKDVFIQLYINNNDTLPFDSLPVRVPPYYLTKTDDQGNFLFTNLRNEPYKIFALADQNGDLIFNQPSEKIAFSDSLVRPYYMAVSKPDTMAADSLGRDDIDLSVVLPKNPDSLKKADSLQKAELLRQNALRYPSCPLFLFEETDSTQRLEKSAFPMEGMALLVFRFPVRSLRVVPLNFDSVAPWYVGEFSRKRDSVRLWINRPNVDSLIAKVILDNKILDTVSLEAEKKENLKKGQEKGKKDKLGMFNSASSTGLNQYKNKLGITFSYPLVRWDFSKVLLIDDKDTVHPEIRFTDSLKRKVVVSHKWTEDKPYKIIIPDSVFFGIQGHSHDTVFMNFRTKSEKDFGNLIVSMNMEKRPGQYIVQLLNEKENLVYEEHVITGSGKVRFDFMTPGKYKLKAISDRNRNSHWDTGNYRLKIQPEEVIYYFKTVEIRANWDVEETWD